METVAVRAQRGERWCKRGFVLEAMRGSSGEHTRKSLRCTDHDCTLTARTSSREGRSSINLRTKRAAAERWWVQ
eukprot:6507447-Prymnesium_polylepis.1